jgi:hypothetical protein
MAFFSPLSLLLRLIANIRIPTKKKFGDPPTPCTMQFLGKKGGYFEKLTKGSKTYDITSEGLGEVFKGESADTCDGKFPLVSMGGERTVKRVSQTKWLQK